MSGIVDFEVESKIENTSGQQINPATEETLNFFKAIVRLLKPLSVVGTQNRLSVDVNTVPTVAISTVTTVNQIAGVPGFDLMKALSRTAYNTGVRGNIT